MCGWYATQAILYTHLREVHGLTPLEASTSTAMSTIRYNNGSDVLCV
jgi:hypothetical protein